ncbi:MAG: DUF3429 domain-containing protein [Bradyrhizobiaceae bacterium]|nr:MAG: DUF3429 domain-containing protein [Bradyrhizobiaceae bacterium]
MSPDMPDTKSVEIFSAPRVPPAASWLGGFGLVPFFLCALLTLVADQPLRGHAALALLAYGAIILSFLGGIHWGLAISSSSPPSSETTRWLVVSVVPSLIAWISLLAPAKAGFLILAAAFALMLWVDLAATRLHRTPAWYPKLRLPLSCGAIAAILIGVFA